jgi:NAD(P)-dependent dehydrogenase (short-subunit alcohol dehydrogenase family)
MIKAIVTGHSRGLGEALADVLLQRGVMVLGVSRGGNPGLAARHGEALREHALDLGDGAALAAWLAGGALPAWLDGARCAVLVNNAGTLAPMGLLGTLGAAGSARGVALNLAAPLMLSDAFCRATAGFADRRILHVSSGAARKPYAGWSVYCATKAALDHHARAVADEAHAGLRIASVAPGVLDTSLQAEIRASSTARFPQRGRFDELYESGGLAAAKDSARRLADHLLGDAFGSAVATDLRELPA